jgi:hypothetical protein
MRIESKYKLPTIERKNILDVKEVNNSSSNLEETHVEDNRSQSSTSHVSAPQCHAQNLTIMGDGLRVEEATFVLVYYDLKIFKFSL